MVRRLLVWWDIALVLMNNSYSVLQRQWSKGKRRSPACFALKVFHSCITCMTQFHFCHQLVLPKKKVAPLIELRFFFFPFSSWRPEDILLNQLTVGLESVNWHSQVRPWVSGLTDSDLMRNLLAWVWILGEALCFCCVVTIPNEDEADVRT